MFFKNRFYVMLVVLAVVALACNLSKQDTPPPRPTTAPAVIATTAPTVDATKITLEIQATALAGALTQQAAQTAQAPIATATQTQVPGQALPTNTTAPNQPPAGDIQSQIKNAKILVYEDAGSSYQLGLWVKSTLDLMGLKYVHIGDAQGNFMSQLNSGTKWDLIIVAAESRKGVQGEFWDVITPKVTADKSALIVEMWYLSQIANGRIQSLTSKCGIEFQSTRKFVDSIYTLDGSNPVFSTPNSGFSLTNYVGYWKDKGGDYVRLTGGDATLLAGGFVNEKSRYGMITSCIEGRVIIQTFSTHDYRRDTMQMLWENYIINTLTNHFKALP
jgi:hypothetical protein